MMKKTKIGIFSPYLKHPTGGEKYILSLAECLSFEHDVDIFWDNPEDIQVGVKRFNLDFSHVNIVKNIFSSKVGFGKRLVATRNYDSIVYLSDGSIPTVLSKRLYLHFQFPVEWVKLPFITKIKRIKIARIICNSYFTKTYIDKKFGVNSLVIYPPVDIFHIGDTKKENIILHVGRFAGTSQEGNDFKKQGVMVEVFGDLIKDGMKGWKFVIATSVSDAENERFEKFRKSVKNLPVEFVINSTNRELAQIYKKAKIYWHATGYGEDMQRHPEKAEHFGISTVEAMSAGVVPVVINAGGQREIVTNEEDGFLWNTLEEWKEDTLKLIKDKGLWEKLSKNAETRSKLFSKTRFCKEVNNAIL